MKDDITITITRELDDGKKIRNSKVENIYTLVAGIDQMQINDLRYTNLGILLAANKCIKELLSYKEREE